MDLIIIISAALILLWFVVRSGRKREKLLLDHIEYQEKQIGFLSRLARGLRAFRGKDQDVRDAKARELWETREKE